MHFPSGLENHIFRPVSTVTGARNYLRISCNGLLGLSKAKNKCNNIVRAGTCVCKMYLLVMGVNILLMFGNVLAWKRLYNY